ncbi:MAG: hypothetical protein IPK96_17965 [Flammeovirgaceae bacterium]|nr:hypothetical protein [Flammeovirgaceae bacterium]
MKTKLIFVLTLIGHLALAQQDSLSFELPELPTDTLLQKSITKADSITNAFQTKADSLNNLYQKQFTKIEAQRAALQRKIDSLNNLKLPTEKLRRKLDSLTQLKDTKISELTGTVHDLKNKATNSFNEIQLPPQMQEPFERLKTSVREYSLPIPNSDIHLPAGELPSLPSVKLPNLTSQLSIDPNLKDLTGDLGKVEELAGKAGTYTKDAQNLVNGNLEEIKSIDKTMESKVASMEGVDQLAKGNAMLGQSGQLTDSAAMKDKMKGLAKQEIMSVAQDHFADKSEVLKQAMDKMSTLKGKYSEVKSLAELPKKLPNPLKGKPFIERLIPGITFQILASDYFLLDVNPMLMYLITPRLSAGAGWNYRFAFEDVTVHKEEAIYGPRFAVEFKWTKGISFRMLPEIMNTTIPSQLASTQGIDPAYREWVPSLFVGIKKDFTVYKNIKGNTEVLYNLYDPDNYSPYGDRFAIRFGFEFPIKKKLSTEK